MISDDHSAPAPEQMKYVLIGEDHSSTVEKLSNYTGEVPWSYLAPHFNAGTLYFVDPSLKLETVGAAFAENLAGQVDAWLKTGDVVKISPLHAFQWETGDTRFEALVVSPFVLCRPLA